MKEEKVYRVYTHTTPDGMVYVGMTGMDLKERWKPSHYKQGHSLGPYIDKFGWKNIQHEVIYTCYDRKEAYEIEGMMIDYWREKGVCINKHRSGLIKVSDEKTYTKSYNDSHKEQRKAYYKEHREERKAYIKAYREEHYEELITRSREKLSSPEGKIYNRVKSYNKIHPYNVTVTPLEARWNYTNHSIVPYFIKHSDIPNAIVYDPSDWNGQQPLF